MQVLYVVPGSGGSFYCQNCLRDLALIDAMRGRGHAVTMLPLYLPASTATPAQETPLFYGAVSLYLRDRFAALRRLPRAWFRPFDARPVLRLAARFAGSTSASGLEALTLSMLRGEDGRQAEELRLVADWLGALPTEQAPDVVVLSNALLTGMAAALKRAARCPVACWLQDEHVWLDALSDGWRRQAQEALAQNARHVSRFLSVSGAYADRLAHALALDRSQMGIVYPGVDPAAYRTADVARRPATVGFLSRLAASEGFDRFVDAFLLLRRDPRFADLRLAATGGPAADRAFMRAQLRKLRRAGALDACAVQPRRFEEDRAGFLAELTLLSVPGGETPEAFGYYALEAMAAGVPTVLPAHGAFPEIAAAAGCGTLVADAAPESVARAWADLLVQPERLRDESARGQLAARTVFSQAASAAALERALSAL